MNHSRFVSMNSFRTALLFTLATVSMVSAREGRSQSADDLVRIGVDSFTRHDYDTAVDKLTQAKEAGAAVDSELGEAKYFQLMWNGLQAEANGFTKKAAEFYQAACALHPSKAGPKMALKRATEGTTEATDVKLAALDNTEEQAIDFRQRVLAKLLKCLSTRDVDLQVQDPADFELGVGVDLLTGAARQKIVAGAVEDTQILTERLVASETSITAGARVELDETTQAALSAEYGKFGIDVHASGGIQTEGMIQASASAKKYTFRLWNEVITKKRALHDPKCTLDSSVLLGEWLDTYGTHYISEVLEGGWVQVTLTKECKSVEERQKLSQKIQGAIGGNGFIIQGEASGQHQSIQALQAVVSAEGLSIEAKSAGATGTFDVSSISTFLAKRTDFKKEVLESKRSTPVHVRIRSYTALELKGFPLSKERFGITVKRTQARSLSDGIMNLVRSSGRSKLRQQGWQVGGDFLWDPQRKRDRETGDRYFREESRNFTITVSPRGAKPTVQKQNFKCRSEHEVLEATKMETWRERIHYLVWEQTDVNGVSDASLQGHDVMVNCVNGRRTIVIEHEEGLTKVASDWVKQRLASVDNSAEVLYPGVPIGNNSSWVCDINGVARLEAAGLEVDESESSAKGRLTKVRLENGLYVGRVDVAIDIKLKGLNADLKFVQDGHAKMTVEGDLSLQPQKSRSTRIQLPIKITGVLKSVSSGGTVGFATEGRSEYREGDLPRVQK